MSTKVIEASKLDNGFWQITILDPITNTGKTLYDSQFYRVNNRDINLKNYPFSDINNSHLYFDKSYSPKFIAQLIYLYKTFAFENGILDYDILKIDKELKKQGITLSKYGLLKINSNSVYPCIDIEPYPLEHQFKCLNDEGTVENVKDINNYQIEVPLLKKFVELGDSRVNMSIWNFLNVTVTGVIFFLVIFLLVIRIDK